MDKINRKVIKRLKEKGAHKMAKMIAQRREKGIKEYGQDIDAANLTAKEVQQHLIEELLDAAVYAEKLLDILDKQKESMTYYRINIAKSVIIEQLVKIEDIEQSK